jgi:hypothetical protein
VVLSILSLLLVLLLFTFLALRLKARMSAWPTAPSQGPFFAKRPLPSPRQVLYQRLVVALPGHLVLNQVPLSEVLGVRRGCDVARWNKRLRSLHFDLVVCASDASVLAAIELDDDASPRARGSDSGSARAFQIKESASACAGVRLLHWQAKALPDQAAIQKMFGVALSPYAEDAAASANQSWWPLISDAGPNPPQHCLQPPT